MKIRTYELHLEKSQKTTLTSCLLGVHAWLVLMTHPIMLLPHYMKLNMQIRRDGAHHLVPRIQSTKKDNESKRINELFVCKSLRTKKKDTCATSREETQMKHLLEFDPGIESHWEFYKTILNHFWKSLRKLTRVLLFSNHLKQMLLIRQKSVLWLQTFSRYAITSYLIIQMPLNLNSQQYSSKNLVK